MKMKKKFFVTASWWIEADSSEAAINLVENAVAEKVTGCELIDSEVEDEEEYEEEE